MHINLNVSIPEFSRGNVELFSGITRRFQKGHPFSTNVPILRTLPQTFLAYEHLYLQSFGGAKLHFDLK
jgi:hypothetical protein